VVLTWTLCESRVARGDARAAARGFGAARKEART